MKKVLPLQISRERFYKTVLTVFKPVPPLDKLRNKELSVLSELIRLADQYKDLGEKKRWRLVFSKESRVEMRAALDDISEASFNNSLSELRRQRIIVDNTVIEALCFSPETINAVEYQIIING